MAELNSYTHTFNIGTVYKSGDGNFAYELGNGTTRYGGYAFGNGDSHQFNPYYYIYPHSMMVWRH